MWAGSDVCGLLADNVGLLAENVGLKHGPFAQNKPRQHMLYVYASLSRLDFQGLSENTTIVF